MLGVIILDQHRRPGQAQFPARSPTARLPIFWTRTSLRSLAHRRGQGDYGWSRYFTFARWIREERKRTTTALYNLICHPGLMSHRIYFPGSCMMHDNSGLGCAHWMSCIFWITVTVTVNLEHETWPTIGCGYIGDIASLKSGMNARSRTEKKDYIPRNPMSLHCFEKQIMSCGQCPPYPKPANAHPVSKCKLAYKKKSHLSWVGCH